tara:strand:+ start:1553 stop:1834 length:282 start_codon:yes stop_codon:yes gene_type:complete
MSNPELKKLEKEFYKLEKEFVNTQNLLKREKNHKTKEKLAQKVINIYNTMKKININSKAAKERAVNASKEREAFKRKSNSGFNTPPKKKPAKK